MISITSGNLTKNKRTITTKILRVRGAVMQIFQTPGAPQIMALEQTESANYFVLLNLL